MVRLMMAPSPTSILPMTVAVTPSRQPLMPQYRKRTSDELMMAMPNRVKGVTTVSLGS